MFKLILVIDYSVYDNLLYYELIICKSILLFITNI